MYLDFEDNRPETPTIESAISRREGLLLSIAGHAVIALLLVTVPRLPLMQEMAAAQAARRAELMRQLEERQREATRFVFVQPRIDVESPRPPARADLSDKDRVAQAPERARVPTNSLPFSRGNTPERIETDRTTRAAGRGPGPESVLGANERGEEAEEREGELASNAEGLLRTRPSVEPREGSEASERVSGGSLGDALRNLEQYVTPEVFDNLEGGAGQFGPWIQFDTKGVEFGPWIRRFIAQIKRNWFIPYAAASFKGHVVITFNVHKSGAITDLAVAKPSEIESFTTAAFNALQWSNPTHPLPEEYPSERAFFTVTFFYNETPPTR